MSPWACLLLLIGLGHCHYLRPCLSNQDALHQQQGVANVSRHRQPTRFELAVEEFGKTLSGKNFTEAELEELLGGDEVFKTGDMMELYLFRVTAIIGLNEIRRVYGLKQQPMACDRYIDEEPIDPRTKINPKAMRYFQLSVFMFCLTQADLVMPKNTQFYYPLTDKLFTRADFILDKFPEVREQFKIKYEEEGIEKFTFDKKTIEKVFKVTDDAKTGIEIIMQQAYQQYKTDLQATHDRKMSAFTKLLGEALTEQKQLLKEDF